MNYGKICIKCMREKPAEAAVCPHCGFDVSKYTVPAFQLPPYTRLSNGRYFLGKAIGSGGFGITYIAFDLKLGIPVAIKELFVSGKVKREHTRTVLMDTTASGVREYEEIRRRFMQEANTLAELDTIEGLVKIRDYFQENGTAYIVMEYLDGKTLKQSLKENPRKMSLEETLELLDPVMNALTQLHKAGIVHRDVSLDNIMCLKNGKVKLIDLGGGKRQGEDGGDGLTVAIKKGYYTPVEQILGRSNEIGPQTDVYALGVTIYKCLCGEFPKAAGERTGDNDIVKPSKLGVKISKKQEAVLLKALAVDPRKRLQSVAELQKGLKDSRKGIPLPVKAAAGILLAGALGTGIFFILRDSGVRPGPDPAETGGETIANLDDDGPDAGLTGETTDGPAEEPSPAADTPVPTPTEEPEPVISGGEGPVAILTNTSTPTPTPTDTPTPTPTNTPTPAPTDTPTPTPTPEPVPTVSVRVGDSVFFGRYETDNDTENGYEPIEWIVLEKDADKALLISLYCLDAFPFSFEGEASWSESYIRTWLNEDLVNAVFTEEEKAAVCTTEVMTAPNSEFGTDGGPDTTDSLFLLSEEEAKKYFAYDGARTARPTEFARAKGAAVDENGNCWWWLRTKGADQASLLEVSGTGAMGTEGGSIYNGEHGVRPAMWVNVSDLPPETGVSSPALSPLGFYTLGSYEQDVDPDNGSDDVAWLILTYDEEKVLLVSRYALDAKPFHNEEASISWTDSFIREWLNGDFCNSVFTDEEKELILPGVVSYTENSAYGYSDAPQEEDRLFLLSEEECLAYLPSEESRRLYATPYAVQQGCAPAGTGYCWWFLRTPGNGGTMAEEVGDFGQISCEGNLITNGQHGIRPAVWIRNPQS